MDLRLDSLNKAYSPPLHNSLKVGFSRISITPSDTVPLAGYSGRDPKAFNHLLDSVFVRTLVMSTGQSKVAIISAELLIIHPDIASEVVNRGSNLGFGKNQIYFTATHTHSSIGGWSPGISGELIMGEFNPDQKGKIIESIFQSLKEADSNLVSGRISYANSEMDMHVRNRLTKEGDEDIWVRNLFIETEDDLIGLTAFAAHATCFNAHSRALTGDFPSYFHRALEIDSLNFKPIYLAGAVASMGPDGNGIAGELAQNIGNELANQALDLTMLGLPYQSLTSLNSFHLNVPLRSPQLKISRNLRIRPWVFRSLLGTYEIDISVVKVNNNLLIGLPCDFSGEVALPLYEYAQARNLNLIITSFNGGYIGYVTKDHWYDLEKYETRTMNWYGPDSGAYFSEIICRIIDTVAE